MSSFTDFTNLVNQLSEKRKIIDNRVNNANDIAGKNETEHLQVISYQYQYLFFFIIAIILILFIFRTSTSDTSKIDTIILIIILLLFLHHIFASYF